MTSGPGGLHVVAPDALEAYRGVGELFAALSSPTRAAIVHRLTTGEQTVGGLAEALHLSQPLVSQHMRVLRTAHLVAAERRGREIAYSLADEHVAHVFLDALHHTEETALGSGPAPSGPPPGGQLPEPDRGRAMDTGSPASPSART